MKKVAIFAYFPFWHGVQGADAVVAQRINMFNGYEKHLIYVGKLTEDDKKKLKEKFGFTGFFTLNPFKIVFIRALRRILSYVKLNKFYVLKRPFKFPYKSKKEVSGYLHNNGIDKVLVNYLWESDLFLCKENDDIFKIIETHDSQYLFCTQNVNLDKHWPCFIKKEDEFDLLKKFNVVIALSTFDYEYFNAKLDNVVYLPFAVKLQNFPAKEGEVITVGFVGGKSSFNYSSVRWFIDNVLPSLDQNFRVNVYGSVVKMFEGDLDKRVNLRGFVEDIDCVYKECDVMVNPAFISGGIKTKNVECLAHGLPLLTTEAGSKGMENGGNINALFISDEKERWVEELTRLKDFEYRKNMGENAFKFANEYFSFAKESVFMESIENNETTGK